MAWRGCRDVVRRFWNICASRSFLNCKLANCCPAGCQWKLATEAVSRARKLMCGSAGEQSHMQHCCKSRGQDRAGTREMKVQNRVQCFWGGCEELQRSCALLSSPSCSASAPRCTAAACCPAPIASGVDVLAYRHSVSTSGERQNTAKRICDRRQRPRPRIILMIIARHSDARATHIFYAGYEVAVVIPKELVLQLSCRIFSAIYWCNKPHEQE